MLDQDVHTKAFSHRSLVPPGGQYRWALGDCTLGALWVAAGRSGVCDVILGDGAHACAGDPNMAPYEDRCGLRGWLDDVISAVEDPFGPVGVPLETSGTGFQERVWARLREIPAGQRRSYAAVARDVGVPRGARAVARACASNRVAVLIPCHRVTRSDGGLGGYRWGIAHKRALLSREGSLP